MGHYIEENYGAGRVLIRGAGDLASGIALRLHRCGFQVVMTEIAAPTTVRRTVAFSPAVYLGAAQVEDVTGVRCDSIEEVETAIKNGKIAVTVGGYDRILDEFRTEVVVDAILAKKNLGTKITDAPTVIGVGPGFAAGEDCHFVVETKRGHYVGRCIPTGSAIPNTGVPGIVDGYGIERLIRASADGVFRGTVSIGDMVKAGDVVGYAGECPIRAQIDGVVRGLLQDGVFVTKGMKSGDVDPRCEAEYCFTVSDKATAIAGGVLEAILRHRQMRGKKVALVLLAAGDSRRFGDNKLLADVEGKPMYRHIVDAVAALPAGVFDKKVVVSQYPEILEDMRHEGFETVENRQSALGISHSVALGLSHMIGSGAESVRPEERIAAVCFSVCDQPWLKAETIAALIDGFLKSGKGMACLSCGGKVGNPAVFSAEYFPELLELTGDTGGRRVILRHPEDVYHCEVKDEKELADIDER